MPTKTELTTAMQTAAITQDETAIAKAVRLAGGVHACSRMLGVAPSSVCHRRDAGYMPMSDAIRLELKTGVPVEQMIPCEQFDEWFAYRMQQLVKSASIAKASA